MDIARTTLGGICGLAIITTIAAGNHLPRSAAATPATELHTTFASEKAGTVVATYTSTIRSPACHVSSTAFGWLATGMSYDEAASTLGCAGRELTRVDVGGVSSVSYGWDASGAPGARMTAMFQNDRLVAKVQFALR